MRDILIVTPSQREKWMTLLKENFLGQTLAADRSKILNEDDIFFEKGQKKNVIKAFSEVPLIIENRELGYRVYFELQEFFFDAEQGRTLFYGFSRYEEMRDPDSEPSGNSGETGRRLIAEAHFIFIIHSYLTNWRKKDLLHISPGLQTQP